MTSKLLTTTTSLFIVLISIGVYKFRTLYYPNEKCHIDPPIELNIDSNDDNNIINYTWNNVCNLFSLEYEEARNKFYSAVYAILYNRNKNNLDIETFTLPIIFSSDSDSDTLTMDIVIIKGNKPGVVVHTSATHGVEGYAGSAIQLAFLDMLSSSHEHQQLSSILSNDNRPTIVLIHSINPYGMKYYRRVNENNVDLNRNCINDFTTFVKDRDPNIADYDTFREFVSPNRNANNMWDRTFGFWFNAIPLLIRLGFIKLKTVLVAGQYHHPTGFSFGGTKLQPSIEVITMLLKDKGFHTGNIFWIDVHTGLGKFAKDTVMFERIEEDESTLSKSFPTAHHIVTPDVADKLAMSGYELTRGLFMRYLQEMNPSGVYAIQEYGTLPAILVGRAMILENMIYHYGGGKKQKEEGGKGSTDEDVGRQLLQSVFYPQSTEWRASIVQRGVALILQAIEYSNKSKSNNIVEP